MLWQSDGRLPLFDTVLHTSADQDGVLSYQVKLVDLYHDGPAVPSVIGESPAYSSLDDALAWARRAIEAFRGGVEP